MTADMFQKIARDFGDEVREVKDLLDELDARTQGLVSDRLVRPMIYLAEGSVEELRVVVELARVDIRDVYWQAEYDCGEAEESNEGVFGALESGAAAAPATATKSESMDQADVLSYARGNPFSAALLLNQRGTHWSVDPHSRQLSYKACAI